MLPDGSTARRPLARTEDPRAEWVIATGVEDDETQAMSAIYGTEYLGQRGGLEFHVLRMQQACIHRYQIVLTARLDTVARVVEHGLIGLVGGAPKCCKSSAQPVVVEVCVGGNSRLRHVDRKIIAGRGNPREANTRQGRRNGTSVITGVAQQACLRVGTIANDKRRASHFVAIERLRSV